LQAIRSGRNVTKCTLFCAQSALEFHERREPWATYGLTPENKKGTYRPSPTTGINAVSSSSQPDAEPNGELEMAVEQAISACGGDMCATIRALIVANEFLESEVSELMKAVSHAYARGRFSTYSG
jgi:hypothetical protein